MQPLITEAEWDSANARRIFLIRKKALSRREAAELRRLTKVADRFLKRTTEPFIGRLTMVTR